jgi:uncharacterized protein (DUF58 family)
VSQDRDRPQIPKEIFRKVRRIEIRTKGLVDSAFAGQYSSAFKGRGMEFSEVREYRFGDDVRTIDWNVTARMGHPYVKCFEEERELTLLLMVDASGSQSFGSVGCFKGEMAAEMSAVLAFLAIGNNDRVGALFFTDRIEKFIPPRKGRQHVLRLIREILAFRPEGRGTDISLGLEYVCRILKRRAIVILLSDFRAGGYEPALRVASRQHDVVAVSLVDPRERELPAVGLVELEDGETGRTLLVDTSDPRVGSRFVREAREREEARSRALRQAKVDELVITPEGGTVEPLMRFFQGRSRR